MNALLLENLKNGTLTSSDAREIYKMLEKKEILSNYHFPENPCKDGYFRIYVKCPTIKSGRKQLSAKTLEELKEKVYQYECGVHGSASKSFKKAFELTLEDKATYKKTEEKKLRAANTAERTWRDYNRYFKDTEFESLYISDITKKDIENVCLMNLQRYDLRKKAFTNLRSILSSVFSHAYCEDWIKDNPYTRVNFKKFSDMFEDDVAIEERMHSEEELSRMIDELHCKQKARPGYSSYWAMEFQILTGTRRGEIPPLTWDLIKENITDNGQEKYISIEKSQITCRNEMHIVNHTKNRKSRKFPVTDELNDFLYRLKARNNKYYPDSNFLFPANTKLGTITNRAVYDLYVRLCDKLDIPRQEGIVRGPHSFRRNAITFVTNATGGNIFAASTLFGNTPKVAQSNYFTGTDMLKAKSILDMRKKVKIS